MPAPPPDARAPSAGRLGPWLAWFAALNVVWLLLVATFDLAETVLGVAASALAATAAEMVRRTRLVSFHPTPASVRGGLAIPGRSVADTWIVLRAVVGALLTGRRLEGRFRAIRLPLPADGQEAAARRAMVTLGASIAANSYVVGFDDETGLMLVHELVPARRRR